MLRKNSACKHEKRIYQSLCLDFACGQLLLVTGEYLWHLKCPNRIGPQPLDCDFKKFTKEITAEIQKSNHLTTYSQMVTLTVSVDLIYYCMNKT